MNTQTYLSAIYGIGFSRPRTLLKYGKIILLLIYYVF